MSGIDKNVEEMLARLADNSRTELDFVRTLSDAIRRVDEQLLREVRNVTLQHEIRREAILGELQTLAGRLCLLPHRQGPHAIDPHEHVAIEAAHGRNGGGDWRAAAQAIDDEFDFSLDGGGPRH